MAACAPTRAADLLRPAAPQRGSRQPAAAAAPSGPAAAALRRRQPGAPQQRCRALPAARSSSTEAAQATAAPPAAAVAAGEVKAVLFDMVRLLSFGGHCGLRRLHSHLVCLQAGAAALSDSHSQIPVHHLQHGVCCAAARRFPARPHCSQQALRHPFPRQHLSQDGVLCHSEEISRQAACEVMRELYGLEVQPEEFLPFTVSPAERHDVLPLFRMLDRRWP